MFLFVCQWDFRQFRPFTSVKLTEVRPDWQVAKREACRIDTQIDCILCFFFLLALSAGRFGNGSHLNHIIIGIINYIQHYQTLPFF